MNRIKLVAARHVAKGKESICKDGGFSQVGSIHGAMLHFRSIAVCQKWTTNGELQLLLCKASLQVRESTVNGKVTSVTPSTMDGGLGSTRRAGGEHSWRAIARMRIEPLGGDEENARASNQVKIKRVE